MIQQEIISRIKDVGSKVVPKDSHLLLYGSRARGDYREDFDWDMLLLLNRDEQWRDFDTISYPIMESGFDMGQYFSVHTYSQKQWDAMNFLPFYKNVERDKIILI